MSKSEAVVIESIEVRELLRFLFYLDILNKLSLLQRKHSKYMYAKRLNFPCFITYLAACMHAFCLFYLYVSLGKSNSLNYCTIFFSAKHIFKEMVVLWRLQTNPSFSRKTISMRNLVPKNNHESLGNNKNGLYEAITDAVGVDNETSKDRKSFRETFLKNVLVAEQYM